MKRTIQTTHDQGRVKPEFHVARRSLLGTPMMEIEGKNDLQAGHECETSDNANIPEQPENQ
ncbi:hypothetical protein ACX3T8_03790 [Corynebacterium pyruviciproducens]